MSDRAYTDPFNLETVILAEEYACLPLHARPTDLVCGGRNRKGQVCLCRMYFRSESDNRRACFCAYDATEHLRGCPNCTELQRRAVTIQVDGEDTTLEDLFSKISSPEKERSGGGKRDTRDPDAVSDTAPILEEDTKDVVETIVSVNRSPRNAKEIYDLVKDGDFDIDIDAALLLDEETLVYHRLDALSGLRIVKVHKGEGLLYAFPDYNHGIKKYEKGTFSLFLTLDGAPNVTIQFKFRHTGKAYSQDKTLVPLLNHAVTLKNKLYHNNADSVFAFVNLRFSKEVETGGEKQYVYTADITNKRQIVLGS